MHSAYRPDTGRDSAPTGTPAPAARVRPACLLAAAALLLAGCGAERRDAGGGTTPPAGNAVTLTDDLGRTVRLEHPARRIVSLVPSATETLAAIGAGDRLVARTDFDHGAAVDALPSVGEGMSPSLEAVAALRPDVVLGWGTDSGRAMQARLRDLGIPFFAVRAEDTAGVFRTVRGLGVLTGRVHPADSLAASLRAELAGVRASVAGRPRPRVFFVVWNDPPMTAGPATFISQVVSVAGGVNVFDDQKAQWPSVSMEEILRRDPDVLVLPQGEKGGAHDVGRLRAAPGWRELRAMRQGRVILLPADLMNRPGPGMARAARILRDGLHPGAVRP